MWAFNLSKIEFYDETTGFVYTFSTTGVQTSEAVGFLLNDCLECSNS